MSRTTDYAISMANAQRWVSQISLTCPKCGEPICKELDVPEPNLMAEKSRDMVSEGDIAFECDDCGEYFEGDVYAGPAHCDIELRSHSDVNVYCDPPGYDRPPEDWYEEEFSLPSDPSAVLQSNLTEIEALIHTHAEQDGSSLINRMIFAQILTYLEAFFCDTLISGLRSHPERLKTFASRDGSLASLDFKAVQVLEDPDFVRKAVEHNLKSRLYHKFGSGKKDKSGKSRSEGVALWYQIAFGFALTPSDAELDQLRSFAALRHDCVHRNGKTKEDEILTLFDKVYLLDALSVANRVVTHINSEMQKL